FKIFGLRCETESRSPASLHLRRGERQIFLQDRSDDRYRKDVHRLVLRLERRNNQRNLCTAQVAAVSGPAQYVIFPGIRTDVLNWRGPGLLLKNPCNAGPNSVTFGAAALLLRPSVNRLALLCQRGIDRKRPFRRADLLDQPFQRVQAAKIRRVLVQEVDTEQMPRILLWAVDGKYAIHLAQIARQTEDVIAVVSKARPLGFVLNRSIP